MKIIDMANSKQSIEEAAEIYSVITDYHIKNALDLEDAVNACKRDFINAAYSDAAKEYWYEQFKAEQKPSDDIKKEFEEKIMRLSEKDKDGDTWIETRNVFKLFRTVLKKLQPELKQVPTDEEIEKMAAEKYPIEMKEFKDFETSNQSILAFNNSLRIAYRESFIKGFKSALQLTNK